MCWDRVLQLCISMSEKFYSYIKELNQPFMNSRVHDLSTGKLDKITFLVLAPTCDLKSLSPINTLFAESWKKGISIWTSKTYYCVHVGLCVPQHSCGSVVGSLFPPLLVCQISDPGNQAFEGRAFTHWTLSPASNIPFKRMITVHWILSVKAQFHFIFNSSELIAIG